MSGLLRLEDMTLQERLKKADYLTRELSEHLRQGYLPKLAALRSAAKVYDPKDVSDNQILDLTLAVLEAEEFTDRLHRKLGAYLGSITEEMRGMLLTEQKSTVRASRNEPIFDVDDFLND